MTTAMVTMMIKMFLFVGAIPPSAFITLLALFFARCFLKFWTEIAYFFSSPSFVDNTDKICNTRTALSWCTHIVNALLAPMRNHWGGAFITMFNATWNWGVTGECNGESALLVATLWRGLKLAITVCEEVGRKGKITVMICNRIVSMVVFILGIAGDLDGSANIVVVEIFSECLWLGLWLHRFEEQ